MNKELYKPISEIAEINPPLPRRVRDDEMVTFLGMAEVMEGGGIENSMTALYGQVKSGFTRFAEQDTLFAKITPCMENGKGAYATNLVNGIGCGSTEFHVLRAKDNGDSNYIYHITMSQEFRQKAEMNMTGSAGQRRVPADFFREYKVYLPKIESQKKIAKILTTIDQLIEKTQTLIDKHTAIKQGMMADLFTRGIDLTTSQLRPPVEQAPHLYKETELGWIPIDWDTAPLGECGAFKNGLNKPKDCFGYGTLFVNILDVYPDVLDTSKLGRMYATDKEINDYQAEPGDIFLDRSSVKLEGVGYPTLYTESDEDVIFCGFIIRFRLLTDTILPAYLCTQMRTEQFRTKIFQVATRSANVNVNQEQLSKLHVSVPPVTEQKLTVDRINKAQEEININKKLLQKLKVKKLGLMQDLLSGKVSI